MRVAPRTPGRRIVAPAGAAVGLLLLLAGCGGPARQGRAGASEHAPAEQERVVATVNGQPIVARQLETMTDAEGLHRLAEDAGSPGQDRATRRGRALDLLIRGELLVQAARAAGLSVPEEALDERLRVARSQFVSEEAFDEYLEEAGLQEGDLRREAERRLLMEAYARSVTDSLVVDEERARRIYEEQKDRFMTDEEVRATRILVRALPEEPAERRAEARRKIEEAHRRAQAGEELAALAREFSDLPDAATSGGEMDFFPRGRMSPEFDAVVFTSPVGGLTPVFETPQGYNVVRVLERRRPALRPFEEVKTSLLMVLAREQRDHALTEEVGRLRAAAEIVILDPELREIVSARFEPNP